MLDNIRNVKEYSEEKARFIAYPMGGIGSGMICLEGTGALSHFSIRNKPDVHSKPNVFSVICIKGSKNIAKVLEGPVPMYKIFGKGKDMGTGLSGKNYGLPRFRHNSFMATFPFGIVSLEDEKVPLNVKITGWSPFIPNDTYNSGLPVAGLEFNSKNTSVEQLECIYSFNASNFMKTDAGNERVVKINNGFILEQPSVQDKPWEQGAFCAMVDDPEAKIDCSWFRGGWFDSLTMVWNNIGNGLIKEGSHPEGEAPSPGASILVPFVLKPQEEKTIKLMLSWYVPNSDLRYGKEFDDDNNTGTGSGCSCNCGCKVEGSKKETYKPWYSAKFANVTEVAQYWLQSYDQLYNKTMQFTKEGFKSQN